MFFMSEKPPKENDMSKARQIRAAHTAATNALYAISAARTDAETATLTAEWERLHNEYLPLTH